MKLLQTIGWKDYELLDSGDRKRFERFGKYKLIRPDPQIIWQPQHPYSTWEQEADGIFESGEKGKGSWKKKNAIPDKWLLTYKDISFWAKLTSFKHTGVFPEQHLHWDFIQEKVRSAQRPTHILNLFAYTGIASLAAAVAGAKVTHLDASHPAIGWAKENQQAAKLSDTSIRWILDDALKFTTREIKRGVRYDGIIMDPPIYGHGPTGEIWDFHDSFPKLIANCVQILTEKPLFIIVNAYAISASSIMLQNVLEDYLKTGTIESGELVLQEKGRGRCLSTGIFTRWITS